MSTFITGFDQANPLKPGTRPLLGWNLIKGSLDESSPKEAPRLVDEVPFRTEAAAHFLHAANATVFGRLSVLPTSRSGYMQASMDNPSCAATKAPSACSVGAGMTPWSKSDWARLARPSRGVGSDEAC